MGTKVSAFSAASTLAGTEALAGVQGGASAKITPAQLATYMNTLVVGSVGVRVLWVKTSANMNSTADQALTKVGTFTNYLLHEIRVWNASTSLTTASGGIYTAATKSGTAVVANTQVYSALTGSTIGLNLTIAGAGLGVRTEAALYLSLTAAQGGAATADFYVLGVPLT